MQYFIMEKTYASSVLHWYSSDHCILTAVTNL